MEEVKYIKKNQLTDKYLKEKNTGSGFGDGSGSGFGSGSGSGFGDGSGSGC